MTKTAALLIGFGGPTSPSEVRPFLASVLQGVKIPPERFDAVLDHYETVGGVSPYNTAVLSQQRALDTWFKKQGMTIPVFVGLRHSSPSFKAALSQLKENHIEKVIGFVLSPFRCYTSFEKYKERIDEAKNELNLSGIKIEYTDPFYQNTSFLQAQSRKVQEVLRMQPHLNGSETFFIFSAHSIPLAMSDKSGYAGQFSQSASVIAQNLGLTFWEVAYQSRSGSPAEPWLGPDVKEVIQKLNKLQFRNVIIIPIGFVCDNVEILYDLDIDARQAAEEAGFNYHRSETVSDDPLFIEMMGKQITQKLKGH